MHDKLAGIGNIGREVLPRTIYSYDHLLFV